MKALLQPASHADPLGDDEFAALMEACGRWESTPRFAVAVSGGPDSTALALLLNNWTKSRGGDVVALTVDHRLREESHAEALAAGERLAAHGVKQILLHWAHDRPPQSAIHASARRARYDLLLETCRGQNIAHLFLAHHADDQAETLLMRLSRFTGLDGLAGMAVQREQDGVTLVRPLLPIRKSRLEATCAARGWEFSRDPANEWERFTRARLRSMQGPLARAGLTPQRLCDIAREAGAARAHLEESCNLWLKNHGALNLYGVASLDHLAWRALDHAMRLRVLTRVLLAVGGSEYPPRGASLERLATHLAQGEPPHHTLAGCHVELMRNVILFMREEGTIEEEVPLVALTPHRRWDNRFVFSIPANFKSHGLRVRRLSQVSRNALLKKDASRVAALPAAMRASLPGIFDDSGLFSVPLLTLETGVMAGQAPVTAVFSPRHGFLVKPFSPSSFIVS